MSDYSVTPYHPDDILIERHDTDSGNVWLKDALDQMVRFTESVLCEANAKEVYDVACILELQASELRKSYNEWRKRNFDK